jgi:hypothetical protein
MKALATKKKTQFSFICPFETRFLINRMNKSLQKKKRKTSENCNFVIHFSKSISMSPLSHNEQRSVFFNVHFPHDCLLTSDWFLSAPGCFGKKRKVSMHPYGRTFCRWGPSSAATRGYVLMHVEREIPRKCTHKLPPALLKPNNGILSNSTNISIIQALSFSEISVRNAKIWLWK